MGHKTRLHFPQLEKKPAPFPSLHLPCQSTRPLWEVCVEACVGERRCAHTQTLNVLLGDMGESPSTHHKKTRHVII